MLFIDQLKGYNIILASQSPRRSELLSMMGIEFSVAPRYEVVEECPANISSEDAPQYLSELKSRLYPTPLKENDLLITSDTLVLLGDRMFGKPKDRADAIAILTELSGKTHKVITGVTLRTSDHKRSFSDRTEVQFNEIKPCDIEYYVDHYKPYDKAGSYAIQEWIGLTAVRSISGSYFNIMGLPTERLYAEIQAFCEPLLSTLASGLGK